MQHRGSIISRRFWRATSKMVLFYGIHATTMMMKTMMTMMTTILNRFERDKQEICISIIY